VLEVGVTQEHRGQHSPGKRACPASREEGPCEPGDSAGGPTVEVRRPGGLVEEGSLRGGSPDPLGWDLSPGRVARLEGSGLVSVPWAWQPASAPCANWKVGAKGVESGTRSSTRGACARHSGRRIPARRECFAPASTSRGSHRPSLIAGAWSHPSGSRVAGRLFPAAPARRLPRRPPVCRDPPPTHR